MATFLPNGYWRWVPTFTLDGSIKIFQTVFMGIIGDTTGADDVDAVMRTYFTSASRPFAAASMYIGYTLAKSEAWWQDTAPPEYFLNEGPVVGTKASSVGTPINTSTLIRKNTGLSGRLYRGRHMLPNMTVAEANISQAGIIDNTGLAVIQGQWDAAMTAWTAGTHDPRLGHSSSEIAPTAYSTVSCLPKVGSMPHRIR